VQGAPRVGPGTRIGAQVVLHLLEPGRAGGEAAHPAAGHRGLPPGGLGRRRAGLAAARLPPARRRRLPAAIPSPM
jgi:hypothetical protein